MAFTYSDRLKYHNQIKQKFNEIKVLKKQLLDSIENDNSENYEQQVNIIFSKVSVIESLLIKIKKEYIKNKEA